ncbi:hypothetical protein BGZ82_005229 [Podila clonocystis]|nr:hypothetical protein BGZ82_005229 [Podila clonocystis]
MRELDQEVKTEMAILALKQKKLEEEEENSVEARTRNETAVANWGQVTEKIEEEDEEKKPKINQDADLSSNKDMSELPSIDHYQGATHQEPVDHH